MRCLGLIPQYIPISRVGAWITTHEYLAGMAARGHHVDVVCHQMRVDPYTIDGVNVYPHGTAVDVPDLIVSHLGDGGYGARVAADGNCPSVRMVHGYHEENRQRLDQYPPALAIYSSHALELETGWDGPGLVAHPPVFPERYTTEPGDAVTLVNLSVPKGGLLLGWIADAHPDLEFIGVSSWGRQMTQQPPNVRVIEPVEDMRDVYSHTRVLLMPSDRESYGRCAVEAACSGIPTIAHPSAGLVEAMGGGATWIDRHDRTAWIEAVGQLRHPRFWKACSDVARAHVEKNDPQATIDEVCDAFERVMVCV